MNTHNYTAHKRKVSLNRMDTSTHLLSQTAQAVPPFYFTVSDNQFWRVTVLGSLSIGCGCHAAGEVCVCVFMCMCVAMLWSRCRVAGRLQLHCYSKQGVFSHSFSTAICQFAPHPPLSSRDQTVNLTHSAPMTFLMVRKTAISTAVMLLLEWLECCIVPLV